MLAIDPNGAGVASPIGGGTPSIFAPSCQRIHLNPTAPAIRCLHIFIKGYLILAGTKMDRTRFDASETGRDSPVSIYCCGLEDNAPGFSA